LSPGQSTRVCPVCRTPNPASSPYCARCNYAFFTQRDATVENFEDPGAAQYAAAAGGQSAAWGPPPAGRPLQPAPAFDEIDAATAPPPSGQASPARAPRRGGRRKKGGGLLSVPEGLDDRGLEALRYKAMQRSLIVVLLLIVVGWVGPTVLGLVGVRSDIIGPVGIVDYVLIGLFYSYARRVGKASKKPLSPTEAAALTKVKAGGWVLVLIPIAGSFLGGLGVLFQTSPMHPIYYLIAGGGIVWTLGGVTSLKERHSYYSVFEFGTLLLLFHPLPSLFPLAGAVLVNAYWFETTFLFLAVGFILMSFALRRMRAGQYDALEAEMKGADEALGRGDFERAIARYDRAVTISHSLFSDKLFKATRAGQRALPPDYYRPWVGKAMALARAGRGAKALAILDLILEVDASNPSLWVNKGDILMALKRPAEAYIAFEQALRISPQGGEAVGRRQQALDMLQRRME
jgi:hypothetical protein